MTPEQEKFVNSSGDTLAGWQLSRATGRLYGYLLLRGDASSSEELRAALSLSSGAVSTAVRDLESWGLVSRIPQPGSRRLLVEATGGFEQLLAASHQRTRSFIHTLRAAEELTENAQATARLRDVTELFTSYVDAGEHVLRERPER